MSFVLKEYGFDAVEKTARFSYENNGFAFTETFQFPEIVEDYNQEALERALFLAFVLVGTSYYKTFPSRDVVFAQGAIDDWQAQFFNAVYQEGMSQFAAENTLTRDDLAHFQSTGETKAATSYASTDSVPLVLQSGGKDSLLLAELIRARGLDMDTVHIVSSATYPEVLDELLSPPKIVTRMLDGAALKRAAAEGAMDGHVPITYIVFAVALIQAILLGKSVVLAGIGQEGEEPYGQIGDLAVMHQWAKTWSAEKSFAKYVAEYISPDLALGSPLRRYSELKVAELFVQKCWDKYSREFSSCNIINYMQGHDNRHLGWCGNCPKCANSFLLFAPFVEPDELAAIFNGENLFKKASLTQTFKGLLDVDGAVKLFECVGETDELRLAYQMAHAKSDEYTLPFTVPESDFDYQKEYPAQSWTERYI